MKIGQIMSTPVIRVQPNETVESAARTLTQYNIGMLPVCSAEGKLCGVVTDRDLVTRCVAANKNTHSTTVRQIMSGNVLSVSPEMTLEEAAKLMLQRQVRRLPVTQNGVIRGMVSLADLAKHRQKSAEVAAVLVQISDNVKTD